MTDQVRHIIEYLTLLAPITLSVGVLLGLVTYSRLQSIHRLLLFYLAIALIVDISSRWMAYSFNNNLILIPVFGLLELLIISRLYFKYLIKIKNAFWIFIIALIAIYNVYEIIILYDIAADKFYCFSRALESLVIVVMSIIFYIKQLTNNQQKKTTFFILNTVLFAFHSLNFILYLPLNFLINESSNVKFYFWFISLLLTVLFYVLIIRIIWSHGKIPKR